jgi:hypothetical protein
LPCTAERTPSANTLRSDVAGAGHWPSDDERLTGSNWSFRQPLIAISRRLGISAQFDQPDVEFDGDKGTERNWEGVELGHLVTAVSR